MGFVYEIILSAFSGTLRQTEVPSHSREVPR